MMRRVVSGRAAAIACPLITSSTTVHSITSTSKRHKGLYFDALDNFWNTPWFENFTPRQSAMEAIGDAMVNAHETLNTDWSVMLFAMGFLIRTCTLYFSMYGERAASRMQHAVPELAPAFHEFETVYYNPKSSSLQIQVAATKLKAERNKVYLKWNTSNRGTMATLASGPLVIFGFSTAVKLISDPARQVESDALVWLHSLQLADPSFILPIACCGMTLLNLELSLRARKLDEQQAWTKNIAVGMRFGCLCLLPAISPWSSGLLVYWLGLSAGGLLQPILLRIAAFRQWFGIMDPPPKQAADSSVTDVLASRMALQVPTLSKAMNPESEDKMISRREAVRRAEEESERLAAAAAGIGRRNWNSKR